MEKINLLSTSIMVTELCTLRCKLCLAYIPYYSEYKHMTLKECEQILKKYFSIVNTVEKMSLTGGEPLLSPYFAEVLQEVLKYEEQITKEIIIITNGTIRFTEDMMDLFKRSVKIKVIVNHYGDISKYARENYELLVKEGVHSIFYTEENRYGWIDCRDHSLKHLTEEDKEKQAGHCAFFLGKKYIIKRGGLYTCTRSAYRIQENIIPYETNDYIDLLDESETLEEAQQKLLGLLNLKYTKSCAYCDGLTEQSVKYKAAEQLERKV